jgi:hypothetical protein
VIAEGVGPGRGLHGGAGRHDQPVVVDQRHQGHGHAEEVPRLLADLLEAWLRGAVEEPDLAQGEQPVELGRVVGHGADTFALRGRLPRWRHVL